MDKLVTLGERLKYARQFRDMSQEAVAIKIPASTPKGHVSTGLIGQIERGENKGSKHLPRIAKILNVSLDWLEEGKGAMEMGQAVIAHYNGEPTPDGKIAVMEYEVDWACGSGIDGEISFEEIEKGEPASYRESWFRENNTKPEWVKRFKGTGDSMLPVIRPNWRVAVATNLTEVPTLSREKTQYLRETFSLPIYCLLNDGSRKLKYAYIEEETNELVLESENSRRFSTERYTPEYANDYIRIIGLVIDISGNPNK